ncbi:MerR family transcriptional regulator [Oenococcus sicerae]|uniref:MerR family transcriptional regulator n=1 Tax=Oenococcus sicerae TaxID=2203724 RepID=UPI0010B37A6E|nr:hypothetical protein OAL24_00222 [Oenococcus sicerae]
MDTDKATEQFGQTFNVNHLIHSMIREDNVVIGISDLAEATGVSQTQLRYWLEKNYIKSCGDEKKKKFVYGTVFRVRIIKGYLDEGFTLSSAVKHADQHSVMVRAFKQVIGDRLLNVSEDDHGALIDFGIFDPQPDKHLYARVTEKETKFELHDAD